MDGVTLVGRIKTARLKSDGSGEPRQEIVLDFGIAEAHKMRDLISAWRAASSSVRVTIESLQLSIPEPEYDEANLPGEAVTMRFDESEPATDRFDLDAAEVEVVSEQTVPYWLDGEDDAPESSAAEPVEQTV